MKLVDMTLSSFIEELASKEPAPGGGAVAALAGAQGAALGAMVCALSLGKPKYAEYEDLIREKHSFFLSKKEKFIKSINDDAEYFREMMKVFALPKTTEIEKTIRREAMQHALKKCTEIPIATLSFSVETLDSIVTLIGKSNKSASSDLGVAAICLNTAVRSSWLNICININSISDEEFVNKVTCVSRQQITYAENLSAKIYQDVLEGF